MRTGEVLIACVGQQNRFLAAAGFERPLEVSHVVEQIAAETVNANLLLVAAHLVPERLEAWGFDLFKRFHFSKIVSFRFRGARANPRLALGRIRGNTSKLEGSFFSGFFDLSVRFACPDLSWVRDSWGVLAEELAARPRSAETGFSYNSLFTYGHAWRLQGRRYGGTLRGGFLIRGGNYLQARLECLGTDSKLLLGLYGNPSFADSVCLGTLLDFQCLRSLGGYSRGRARDSCFSRGGLLPFLLRFGHGCLLACGCARVGKSC